MENAPAKIDERPMTYTLDNGDDFTLTLNQVRQYLISGKTQFVTNKEIIYFMHLCKARKLNPFLADCYLVKYSQNDNAQIIESVHSKREKARKAPDCKGWESGIAIINKSGEYEERRGEILLEGEVLVGGWFKATPAGWDTDFYHSVNLAPYIKTKFGGEINQFWQPAKQPHMIHKVAESQGLTALWREYCGDGRMEGEVYQNAPTTLSAAPDGTYEVETKVSQLEEAVSGKADEAELDPEPTPEPEPTVITMREDSRYKSYDPFNEPLQERYVNFKLLRLRDILDQKGVKWTDNMSGRELHERLLHVYKEELNALGRATDEKAQETPQEEPESENLEVYRAEWKRINLAHPVLARQALANQKQKGLIKPNGIGNGLTAEQYKALVMDVEELKALEQAQDDDIQF